MKRALLIAGGTIGGLGAVLSITPPHFGSSTGIAGGIKTSGSTSPTTPTATTPTAAPTQSAAPTPATPATPTKTKKAKPAATKKATAPTTAPAASGASGTFTGATSNTQFGPVQVTAAKALQFPNRDFRSQSISSQAIPYLVQETLAASSSNIQGVGGASYTSQGWYDSLVSALAKAGMK